MAGIGENESINDILTSPTRLIERAENVPARLFRQILIELNVGPKLFKHKVQLYLNNPHNGIADDPIQKQNHRGNLMKELAQSRMTWQVFEKGLRVLDAATVVYDVYIQNGTTGVTTRHQMMVENYPVGSNQFEDFSNAHVVDKLPIIDNDPDKDVIDVNVPETSESALKVAECVANRIAESKRKLNK